MLSIPASSLTRQAVGSRVLGSAVPSRAARDVGSRSFSAQAPSVEPLRTLESRGAPGSVAAVSTGPQGPTRTSRPPSITVGSTVLQPSVGAASLTSLASPTSQASLAASDASSPILDKDTAVPETDKGQEEYAEERNVDQWLRDLGTESPRATDPEFAVFSSPSFYAALTQLYLVFCGASTCRDLSALQSLRLRMPMLGVYGPTLSANQVHALYYMFGRPPTPSKDPWVPGTDPGLLDPVAQLLDLEHLVAEDLRHLTEVFGRYCAWDAKEALPKWTVDSMDAATLVGVAAALWVDVLGVASRLPTTSSEDDRDQALRAAVCARIRGRLLRLQAQVSATGTSAARTAPAPGSGSSAASPPSSASLIARALRVGGLLGPPNRLAPYVVKVLAPRAAQTEPDKYLVVQRAANVVGQYIAATSGLRAAQAAIPKLEAEQAWLDRNILEPAKHCLIHDTSHFTHLAAQTPALNNNSPA